MSSAVPLNELEEYLEKHPEFVQKWLLEKASPETVKEVLASCALEDNKSPSTHNNNNNRSNYRNVNNLEDHDHDHEEEALIQRSRSRSKRNSITSDRFQSWLSSTSSPKSRGAERLANPPESLTSRFESLEENALFIELVKDISNELDVDVLCHKILVNVGFLTGAERCNLYLARGPSEQRYLVPKLLDVTTESDGEPLLLLPPINVMRQSQSGPNSQS